MLLCCFKFKKSKLESLPIIPLESLPIIPDENNENILYSLTDNEIKNEIINGNLALHKIMEDEIIKSSERLSKLTSSCQLLNMNRILEFCDNPSPEHISSDLLPDNRVIIITREIQSESDVYNHIS